MAWRRIRLWRWDIPEHTTSMKEAIEHPDTDVVVVGLPNFLHEEAITMAADAGKAVLVTKPLARSAEEAKRILDKVEDGLFYFLVVFCRNLGQLLLGLMQEYQ